MHSSPYRPSTKSAEERQAGQRQRLERLIDSIAADRRSADAVLQDLVDCHGARHRFICGTYQLRLDGVLATCTSGGQGLLNSWMCAARRKLERAPA